MKFLLFIGEAADAEPYDRALDNIQEWVADLEKRGAAVIGDRLVDAAESIVVRRRNGETIITDGPYVEAKEWIAGFDVIDVASRDEAVEIAAAHPMSRFGVVVIRELWGDRPW